MKIFGKYIENHILKKYEHYAKVKRNTVSKVVDGKLDIATNYIHVLNEMSNIKSELCSYLVSDIRRTMFFDILNKDIRKEEDSAFSICKEEAVELFAEQEKKYIIGRFLKGSGILLSFLFSILFINASVTAMLIGAISMMFFTRSLMKHEGLLKEFDDFGDVVNFEEDVMKLDGYYEITDIIGKEDAIKLYLLAKRNKEVFTIVLKHLTLKTRNISPITMYKQFEKINL